MILAMVGPEEKRRFRLGWSLFRRAHQATAKRCHQASHAAREALRPQRTPSSPSSRPTTTPTVSTVTALANEAFPRLADQEWERVRPLLPPYPPSAGSAGRDHRTTLEGVLWVLNNGASWRDLPEEEFGPWETVYGRYRRWRKEGRWQQVVETLLVNETR